MIEEVKFTAAEILEHERRTGVSARELSRAFAKIDPRVRAVGYRTAAPGSNLPFELEVRLSKDALDDEFQGPGEVEGMRVSVARTGDIVALARDTVLSRPVRGGCGIGAAPLGERGTFACRTFRAGEPPRSVSAWRLKTSRPSGW